MLKRSDDGWGTAEDTTILDQRQNKTISCSRCVDEKVTVGITRWVTGDDLERRMGDVARGTGFTWQRAISGRSR